MPHANSKHSQRLNPHQPLVFDTRTLGPAAVRSETRTAPAPASLGARCLDLFATATEVRFTELFAYEAGDDDADDEYLLDGDLLDLEPALRDALVLELPLAPLCADDCPGLCSECGVRLADAGAGHGHGHADAGTDPTPDGTPVPDTREEG